MKKKNKRGSFQDIFFIALFGLMTAMFFVIGYMMTSKVNTELQASAHI